MEKVYYQLLGYIVRDIRRAKDGNNDKIRWNISVPVIDLLADDHLREPLHHDNIVSSCLAREITDPQERKKRRVGLDDLLIPPREQQTPLDWHSPAHPKQSLGLFSCRRK